MFVHCDQFEIEFLNLPSYIPDFVCHDLSKYVKNHCRDQLSMKHYWGCMDWAYSPMIQSEEASQSEDGQLR